MSEININEAIETTVAELLAELPELLNPYAIYQIGNAVLEIVTPDDMSYLPIRSQYMYNYAGNGLIVRGSKRTAKTGNFFNHDEIAAFLIRYLPKRIVAAGSTAAVKVSEKVAAFVASKTEVAEVVEEIDGELEFDNES